MAPDEVARPASRVVTIRTRPSEASVDPVLCSFPGGLPAALRPDAVHGATLPEFALQKRRKNKNLIGKDHACLYTARLPTASQWPPPPRPSQVCVGIYDKKTGEVTLQPVSDQGYVYALSQTVPAYQRKQELQRTMTPLERRKALFEDFGSAKKRKVMRSQEANRVNVESVVGAAVATTSLPAMSESNRQAMEDQRVVNDNTDESVHRQTAVDKATVEWRKTFLPPYNEAADEAANVYSARQIAGPAVWARLSRMVGKCLEKDNVLKAIVDGPQREDDSNQEAGSPSRRKRDEWHPSVLRIIGLCVPRGDAAKSQLVCALLLQHFLSLYLKLHARRHIGTVESDRPNFFGAPSEVGQRWLESFTTPAPGRLGQMGHVMSQANKDKCKVHLFLLALMAEGGNRVCSENIIPLAKDLQIDGKDGAHLLRLAGCTVANKGADRTMAALTTPLTFPSIKTGSRRS
jgi:hypothetical protein